MNLNDVKVETLEKIEPVVTDLIKRGQEETTLKEYYDISKEKERNLLINLTKYLIKFKNVSKEKLRIHILTEKEINDNILYKKIDQQIYKEFFFKQVNDGYLLKEDVIKKLSTYLCAYEKNKNVDEEEQLVKKYKKLKDIIEKGFWNNSDKYAELLKEATLIAIKLHWKYLPIYTETMLRNRGCSPEEKTEEYYNNFHAIEDLYLEIKGESKKLKDMNGDFSLDKLFRFELYTHRWGHYDSYEIKRTIYGWEHVGFNNLAKSLKDGNGGLYELLNHDGVFFPKDGVAFALKMIWDEADNNEIDFDEMKNKIQEVFLWISDVEKNMRRMQPEWCNYY